MDQQEAQASRRGSVGPAAGQASRDGTHPSSPAAMHPVHPAAGPATQPGFHHAHAAGAAPTAGPPPVASTSSLPAIPTDPSAKEQQQAAKQSLKQWWTKFTKQQQQQQQSFGNTQGGSSGSYGSGKDSFSHPAGVFGVPLTESLKYAGVAISMVGPDGVNQVYGYIPIVVAKCGLFLKQKATTVEGVFRISGSTRRMKELQDIFDRPPSYGRDVVWGPWSVHDAASVLRRYLNQMPEPVVPYELYDEFRNALPPVDKVKDAAAINASIQRYKALIACLPSSSKYLLCYVLDLLNVFHRHHAQNLMPAANLAVVFQPGLIRPPDTSLGKSAPLPGTAETAGQSSEEALNPPNFPHLSRVSSNPLVSKAMTASSTNDSRSNTSELQRRQDEIKINQEVLEFLINHQDHFVALPEMSSSSETSPVSPTSGSGQSRGSSIAQQTAVPTATSKPVPATHQQSAQQQIPQQQRQPVTTVPRQPAVKAQSSGPQSNALNVAPPVKHSQVPKVVATPVPSSSTQQIARSSKQANESATTQLPMPQPQRQLQPHRPPKSPSRTGSPAPFKSEDGRPNTGRSSPSSRPTERLSQPQLQPLPLAPAQSPLQNIPQPQPQQRFTGPSLQGRSSPVQMLGQLQQTIAKPSKPVKDSEKQEKNRGENKQRAEDRKPRKLKKGRTPNSNSGTNTPLSPPIVAWDASGAIPPLQYHHSGPHHSASTPPAHVYDEDTPLSQGMAAAGPGVKRSRTLPSPGDKASSARLVSGRRGSDSRAAPSSTTVEGRLGLESRPTTTPSPLRSPIPRAAPSPLISHRQAAQTAAELERDQSESSDAQAGPSDKKKGAGWRRAFKRDKEREYALLSPASASVGYQPGTHSPASSHSADDTGRKGLIQESMTIQTPHRRPSTSSAAKTEHSDVSGQTQLRAVRNPPLHGHGKEGGGSMSKRDAKKAAEHTSEFSVEAIRDAVSNMGR